MKPEQRLLLSLGLTLGVLLLWTALFPSPKNPTRELPQLIENNLVTSNSEPEEPLLETALGPFKLGVGTIRGGVQSLRTDRAELLAASNPGLLQVELVGSNAASLQFENRAEGGSLLSTAGPPLIGSRIVRELSLSKENEHLLTCTLRIINESRDSRRYQLRLVAYRPLHLPHPEDHQYLEGRVLIGEKTEPIRTRAGQRKEFLGAPSWITAQGKSYTVVVRPAALSGMFHVEHPASGTPVGWLTLPEVELAPAQQAKWEFKLYAGPLSLESLKKAGLEETLSFGFFSGVAKLLLGLLNWSQAWLRNYGLAIMFLGFLVWAVFFPLTWSGIRMTKVMAKLQPQIERLKKEHGKDPQRMNREVMDLYKKHRANPLSGCLPLVFQMPIFIALFQVLSRSPELRGATFLWIRDLSAPDAFIRFPSKISILGLFVIQSVNLLPLLMMGAMFLQQKMTQPTQVAATPEQAIQQKMFRWFPLFFGFLFYGLPSGLVLYWVTNTALTLGQYLLYFRLHRE